MHLPFRKCMAGAQFSSKLQSSCKKGSTTWPVLLLSPLTSCGILASGPCLQKSESNAARQTRSNFSKLSSSYHHHHLHHCYQYHHRHHQHHRRYHRHHLTIIIISSSSSNSTTTITYVITITSATATHHHYHYRDHHPTTTTITTITSTTTTITLTPQLPPPPPPSPPLPLPSVAVFSKVTQQVKSRAGIQNVVALTLKPRFVLLQCNFSFISPFMSMTHLFLCLSPLVRSSSSMLPNFWHAPKTKFFFFPHVFSTMLCIMHFCIYAL